MELDWGANEFELVFFEMHFQLHIYHRGEFEELARGSKGGKRGVHWVRLSMRKVLGLIGKTKKEK